MNFNRPLLKVITGQQLAVPFGDQLVDSLRGPCHTLCGPGDGDDLGCGGLPIYLWGIDLHTSGILREGEEGREEIGEEGDRGGRKGGDRGGRG